MLLIFILIAISRSFYTLAFGKGRSGASWATIGIATYFGVQILIGLVIGFSGGDYDGNDIGMNLLVAAISCACAYIPYRILENLPDLSDDEMPDILD
jgi:hypothetical protein